MEHHLSAGKAIYCSVSHDSFSTIILSCAITLQIKNCATRLRLEVISESGRADLLKNYVRCGIHKSIFFLNPGASGSFGHTYFDAVCHWSHAQWRHCETPDCGCVKQEQEVKLCWVSRQLPDFYLILVFCTLYCLECRNTCFFALPDLLAIVRESYYMNSVKIKLKNSWSFLV